MVFRYLIHHHHHHHHHIHFRALFSSTEGWAFWQVFLEGVLSTQNGSEGQQNPYLASFCHSCINIYAHSCLISLSNGLEVMFKQWNPCSDHEIHELFEHGFYLKILKTDRRWFTWFYMMLCRYFVTTFVNVNIQFSRNGIIGYGIPTAHILWFS